MSGAQAQTPLDEGRAYRRTLGCFATGVALILANGPKGVTGITINSFTSVSLNPRLVLWCLDDRSDRYDIFAAATHWSVNILAAEQQAISDRFARSGAFEAGDLDMTQAPGAAPTLNAALANLSCRSHAQHTIGDHLVLVGEVHGYAMRDGAALGYLRGGYRHFPQEA